jgi:hypothetical protein
MYQHLFATIELHGADSRHSVASSKKGFVKLLTSRPDVVKYIRKLTYTLGDEDYRQYHDRILSNFLRTISRLNCLTIMGSYLKWNRLDSSLTSAFLHLMHLPTINHIDLSDIQSFPLSTLSPSVNLHRIDLSRINHYLQKMVPLKSSSRSSSPKFVNFTLQIPPG